MRSGGEYDPFWALTPREVYTIMEGRQQARMAAFERQRELDHELARNIAFAFHRPAKMPDYKPLKMGRNAPAAPAAQEAQLAQVRGYFISRALQDRRGRTS